MFSPPSKNNISLSFYFSNIYIYIYIYKYVSLNPGWNSLGLALVRKPRAHREMMSVREDLGAGSAGFWYIFNICLCIVFVNACLHTFRDLLVPFRLRFWILFQQSYHYLSSIYSASFFHWFWHGFWHQFWYVLDIVSVRALRLYNESACLYSPEKPLF